MKVLISSTGKDLEAYREAAVAVCRDFGHEPVYMENLVQFAPSKTTPEAACRDAVAQCQLVVVLVAYSYGTLVPGEERSFTELEYDTALSLDHVQLQGWLMRDDHPWPPSLVDRGDRWNRLERFREKVSQGHLAGFFGDLQRFRADLGVALQAGALKNTGTMTATGPLPIRAPEPCAVPAYIGSMEFIGRSRETAWLDEWAGSADPVAIVDAIGGTGKSALTWQWWDDPAQDALGWSGRFWWSFYERGNTLPEMLRAFLDYCGATVTEGQNEVTLVQRVLAELSGRPYLLVLDGVERLLDAYLRADAASFGEDSLAQLNADDARRITDPNAYRFFEQLLGVRRSRIVMSTRLVPDVYLTLGGRMRQGASLLQLRGLSDGDLLRLLARLEITGTEQARDFFELLDNHPLLVKVVLGQVRDHRPAPGDFGAWLADPKAGGAFSPGALTLTERSHHILAHSLDRLDPQELRLLQRLAVPYGSSDWPLIKALNPYRPNAADATPWEGLPHWLANHVAERLREEAASERPTPARVEAERRLTDSLERLEQLGLVWWDRDTNLYDMHPVVRSHVRDTLAPDDERRTHGLVADHFGFGPRTWDEKAVHGITHDERIAVFLACVGAGWLETAGRIWETGDWGHRLVWDEGHHGLAVVLLRALVDRVNAGGGWTGHEADLAVAEERFGQVEAAVQRSVHVLMKKVRRPLDADSVAVALVNTASAAEACGEAALNELCEDLLGELGPLVPTPAARARPFLGAAYAAWQRMDSLGCLMAVQDAREVPPNPYDPEWDGTLEWLRLASLADRGEWEALGEIYVDQPRFGTTWFARRRWARFCWDAGSLRHDLQLSLNAARELDLWRRRGGCESFREEEAVTLAQMGRDMEARSIVDDALTALSRVHSNQRPHLELAKALALLGDQRAEEQALAAYRQACARTTSRGPRRDVHEAETLLHELGVTVPDRIPATASSTVVPEGELRAYIESVRRGDVPASAPTPGE